MSKKTSPKGPSDFLPGVGLDVGTMNIIASRRSASEGTQHTPIRDAFLDLELDAKRSLKLSKVDYVQEGNNLVVVGDSALTMANLFRREARRPLQKGVISAGELDAQRILSLLVKKVLGTPTVDGEHCFYSVPAAPLDDPEQDIIYHTEVFRKILQTHGYTAHPTNEASAIVYSQCAEDNFSGLAVSFGSGMCNIALLYQASVAMSFSVARGGDWVDRSAAKATGKTASQICSIKEKGADLCNPTTREQEAIGFYLTNLIDYCLKAIMSEFRKVSGNVTLPDPIPFVVSGGTSMATGFMEVFKTQFESIRKSFPIEISEVRHATDPLTAVSSGLLVLAMEEYEEDDED